MGQWGRTGGRSLWAAGGRPGRPAAAEPSQAGSRFLMLLCAGMDKKAGSFVGETEVDKHPGFFGDRLEAAAGQGKGRRKQERLVGAECGGSCVSQVHLAARTGIRTACRGWFPSPGALREGRWGSKASVPKPAASAQQIQREGGCQRPPTRAMQPAGTAGGRACPHRWRMTWGEEARGRWSAGRGTSAEHGPRKWPSPSGPSRRASGVQVEAGPRPARPPPPEWDREGRHG